MSNEDWPLPLELVLEIVVGRVRRAAPSLRQRLRAERKQAPRLADELSALAPAELERRLVRRRQASRPLVETLLRRSRAAMEADQAESARLAEVALVVLEHLPRERPQHGGVRGWHDLQGIALARLGNARRVLCQWKASHEAFARAYRALAAGTGDCTAHAEVYCLHASLLRDRCQYPAALRCLAAAERIHGELGAQHERGRALLKRADVLDLEGRSDAALSVQIEALGCLDEDRDAVAALAGWANLAEMLRRAGRADEAARVLEGSRGLAERLDQASNAFLTWRWIEGRVALSRRKLKLAETSLERARSGFAALKIPFNTGLVELDLCRLYHTQDRLPDLLAAAERALADLTSQQLHSEALATVLLLQGAVARRQVALDLLERTAASFDRCPTRRRAGG